MSRPHQWLWPLLLLLASTATFTTAERSKNKRGYDFGVWQPLSPDYSWTHRSDGARSREYWTPSLSEWSHYNITSLLQQSLNPVSWTAGRVCKNWIAINNSACELWSLYEPSAIGHWPVPKQQTEEDENEDNNLRHAHHVYVKTPFRLTQLPGVYLPASVDLPDGHDSSRVTVVQANAASFSGPRWLPTPQQVEILQYMHDQGDDEYFYRRWCFSELWLSEAVDSCDNARKLGLFVQYHGLTGELLQCIQMRERSLMPTLNMPEEDLLDYQPDFDCDLDRMQDALNQLDNDGQERAVLQSPAAQALAAGEPIEHVLELGAWDTFSARIVQSQGLLGPEVACVLDDRPASELVYASPYLDDPDSYLDVRWKDTGMYARIPKRMAPHMDDVCLEIGALTASGDFHRVMAVGSRSSGSLHTTVYERWSHRARRDSASGSGPWGVKRRERERPVRDEQANDNYYR